MISIPISILAMAIIATEVSLGKLDCTAGCLVWIFLRATRFRFLGCPNCGAHGKVAPAAEAPPMPSADGTFARPCDVEAKGHAPATFAPVLDTRNVNLKGRENRATEKSELVAFLLKSKNKKKKICSNHNIQHFRDQQYQGRYSRMVLPFSKHWVGGEY